MRCTCDSDRVRGVKSGSGSDSDDDDAAEVLARLRGGTGWCTCDNDRVRGVRLNDIYTTSAQQ
jgi:hypothetical protein